VDLLRTKFLERKRFLARCIFSV